jgi:ABC-type uncharacterized transport system substrate-binding protein
MQPHSFSKRLFAAIALMFDEQDKVIKRSGSVCVFTSVSEAENQKASTGLYKELADDEMKFYQYFRMSKQQINYLLQKTEKDLKKKNTTFREAISRVEKLVTCLR